MTREIILKTRHIPSKFNMIVDNLSRPNKVLQTEWSICSTVLSQIFSKWGQPMSDLFATWFNNKLPFFCPRVPDHRAWAVDALSLEWNSLFVCKRISTVQTDPPSTEQNQEHQLHDNLDSSSVASEILVQQPVRTSHGKTTSTSLQEGSHISSQGTILNPNPEILRLHAWRLSGNQLETGTPLSIQPLASQMLTGNPQTGSIPLNGGNSVIGVVKGRLIQSILLVTC